LFRINWFVLAQTISYTVTLVIGLVLLLKRTGHFNFQFRITQILPVIIKLKPYATLVLLMAIYYRADSIILGIMLPDGDEQAGIFAHGFRILDFMSNYALLFPILLLPIFSKIIFQKEKVDSLLQFSSLLLIAPSIAAIAPAIVYRYELFNILYNEQVKLSANVFAILTISYIGMCISYTFGALLTANGNLKQLNIMAASAVVISISLNLLFIPQYQVMGAAIANASTQVFTIIVHIILVWYIFKLKFNLKIFVKFIAYLLCILAGVFLIKLLPIHWIEGAIILFIFGLLFALITGLVSIKGIRSILLEKIQ
jgi:O-antigen/teichoic acid export membrane protein